MALRDELLKKRYLKPNETEDNLWQRVAEFVTRGLPQKTARYSVFDLLKKGVIIYNSPILMNAGTKKELASACYVLPVYDDLDSISDMEKIAGRIFKLGAGVGVDYSYLRPEGTPINSGGTSSGPCSFMEELDKRADVIKSGGKRRAAVLTSLRVDHPDIEQFITYKRNDDKLLNINISVMFTDDFMMHLQLEPNKPYNLTWNGKVYKQIEPQKLWDLFIENMWLRGDPGAIFIDKINAHTNSVDGMEYKAVNACAEFPLYDYESCLIGSINLGKLVITSKSEPNKLDYDTLIRITNLMTLTLDNVITNAYYPTKEIAEAAKRYRRIGVGVTGIHDMLIKLGIRYGSAESLDVIKKCLTTITKAASDTSKKLYRLSSSNPSVTGWHIHGDTDIYEHPRRNLATTVIAPTGSTSILCGAESSGIEPIFAVAYRRRALMDDVETEYTIVNELFKKMYEDVTGKELTQEVIDAIVKNNGSVQRLSVDLVPKCLQEIFVTAYDLTPKEHLNVLIAAQSCIENSISKTINVPNSFSKEDISDLLLYAYNNNVKGITIFRDGCKSTQVLVTGTQDTPQQDSSQPAKIQLPDTLDCIRVKLNTPTGNSLYVMVSFSGDTPVEVFANLGKSGFDDYAYTEALGRVISLALRHGVPYTSIIKTLRGIRGKDVSLFNDKYVFSIPDAIAIALQHAVSIRTNTPADTSVTDHESTVKIMDTNICPECGSTLVSDNGCLTCPNCLWSKCS